MRLQKDNKKNGKSPRKNNEGFALIEVILSAALLATFGVAFQTLSIQSAKLSRLNQDKLKATMYLRELIEITKDLEQTNWTSTGLGNLNCVSPKSCHPVINLTTNPYTWELVEDDPGNPVFPNGDAAYTQSITIEPVNRDNPAVFPNEIVEAPSGSVDPNTKKITATIIRKNIPSPNTLTLETYVYFTL
ncbi:MAG: hypothetical protein A3A97_04255 [Candidatus Terrybacteria bacterium RIFCSPLOWO2_01_FULL_40_23]|uniref:Uncharacterized protein n=1 Tax=Candidatus Terrybacteria bacterium RIFCSPLOWO2_01_FULL_40_23 TaxID=1802366 RepID=A0A1G2PZ61_9BACT|nr:MAG: hypothetical protein A3A97_04255 [Candidatus Terrybacteria bacterium RIFCSPLOWO2_01_FULL_40_23]